MQIPNNRTRSVLIALVGTTAWATTGIFFSVLLNRYQLAPLALVFWRDLFIAVVALAGLRAVRPAALRISRKDLPFFLATDLSGWQPSTRCGSTASNLMAQLWPPCWPTARRRSPYCWRAWYWAKRLRPANLWRRSSVCWAAH